MINDKLERKIIKLKNGDMSAFDYVYKHTNRSVYFTALYIVRDKMTAEDVLQETFIKAVSSIGQYKSGTNFTAWITSVGRSIALNHIKKRRREILTDFEEDEYRYGREDADVPYIFDLAAKILTEEEYRIVMMCQVAGYKRREAAELLDMPIGTVTWKFNEAIKKLKQNLEKEEGA